MLTLWTAPRSSWPLWLRLLLGGLLLGLLMLVGVGVGATYRPDWFSPAVIDRSRLAADKRAFVDMLDGIGDALNDGRPTSLDLSADQLNRWLTARAELPEAYQPPLGPLQHPQILLTGAGRVRLAALASWGGFEAVLWTDLRIELAPQAVVVTFERVRVGGLPAPLGLLASASGDQASTGAVRAAVQTGGPLRLPRDGRWPNGRQPYYVDALEIAENRLRLTLTPGRMADAERSPAAGQTLH